MRYLAQISVTEKWRKTGAPGRIRTCDFAWNTAFGIMTNSGWYDASDRLYSDPAQGRVTHMWYTPINEIYSKGYKLLY
jgi:hypothetical protein